MSLSLHASATLALLLPGTAFAESSVVAAPPGPAAAVEAPQWTVPIFHVSATMLVMRGTEAWLWPNEFANFEPAYVGQRYAAAYTQWPKFEASAPAFQWDGDGRLINLGGHALFGSEAVLRARQCGVHWVGALAFAAVASTAWEYGVETTGARPSAQDLVYTPLAGLALGEGRYVLWRAARGSGPWSRVARALLDPLGELERGLGTDC